MKTFRDLSISGTREQIRSTIAEIERSLVDGWERNSEAEKKRPGDLAGQRFCIQCPPAIKRQGAMLVFLDDGRERLNLVNIVPDELGQLTEDEYNSILDEFLQRFATNAATKSGSQISTSSGFVTIDDWFSPATAEELRRFLKVTRGHISHPADEALWQDFLIAAHAENAPVHGDLLGQWLIEDAGCPEYVADKLASQYQFSQELLGRIGA